MTITVEHLSKSFPGTRALDDVGLRILAGEVHALAGANGSGKSTLVKVLTGVYQPDGGWIELGDQRFSSISSPSAAARLGVRVVHQEAPLIDTLSVAECVALFRGYPVGTGGRVLWKSLHREVTALFATLEVSIDPAALAGTLNPAERALVSLAIALDGIEAGGSRVLVLDEATASLPESDATAFLRRIRALAQTGLAVLLVTHRISEIPEIADTVTVLANGKVVHHGRAAEVDEDFIIAKMVGGVPGSGHVGAEATRTSLTSLWAASERTGNARIRGPRPVIDVVNLRAKGILDISFRAQPGEIIGFTGLSNSGVAELPYVLAGAQDRTGGAITLNARPYPAKMTPRLAMATGLALVPADRLRQGGVRNLSIRDNVVLPDAAHYWRHTERERAVLGAAIDEFDIQPQNPAALFERLSGGNQQKVVLSKWLLVQPSVLVLDDPTSGVDPRSRRLVFDAVRSAADEGITVILLSSEHEQLVAMCSRVYVLRAGTVAAQLTGSELTREALARWSFV